MRCPKCNSVQTKVIDSRTILDGRSIRRRRKCETCENRYTTYERLEMTMPSVVKIDGRREPYQRTKLIKGISNACQKRPISIEQIETIAEEYELEMQQLHAKEVTTDQIGGFIMKCLKEIDPVSYIRYASFYWDYETVEGFVVGLQNNVEQKRFENKGNNQNATIQ